MWGGARWVCCRDSGVCMCMFCVCVWSMMKWLELSQVVAPIPSICTLPLSCALLLALAVPFFRQFIHKFRVSSQLIRHDYTHTHTHWRRHVCGLKVSYACLLFGYVCVCVCVCSHLALHHL